MSVAKKNDLAYRVLKKRILGGEYSPGSRIVVSRVCAELGISVIPVREALSRLESERLIKIVPYTGAIVAAVNNDEIMRIMEITAVLEGYATRLAFPRAGAVVGALEHYNSKMADSVSEGDLAGFSDQNRQFHITIYGACGSQNLIDSLQGLWNQFSALSKSTLFHMMPERAAQSVAEHQVMLERLGDPSSDPLELEILARKHKLRTIEAYSKLLGTTALRAEETIY